MDLDDITRVLLIGVGATLVSDAWGLLRQRVSGMAPPDYGLVGRWIGHMPRGHFRHERIAAANPVRGELAIGWVFHYLVGVTFAFVIYGFTGSDWLRHPTPIPALAVGIATVLAPFLILQPGMGAGLFAHRTPRPGIARLHSLAMHAAFGFGLWLSAWLLARSLPPHGI